MATKNRLSLFSFGLASSTSSRADDNESLASAVGPKHVSGGSDGITNGQLSSPMNLPVSEVTQEGFPEVEESDETAAPIFERSVQNLVTGEVAEQPKCNKCCVNRSRSCTHNSSISLLGQFFTNEDYIPPALDASTQILSNKNTNLDDVEMVYSNRRNSLVIGLSAALGRPVTPSRKNSAFSIHSQLGIAPMTLNESTPMSPPRLNSAKSSLSFYSYADMVNNDETCKSRPGFRQLMSQSMVPTAKKMALSSRVPTMTSLKTPVRHMSIKDRTTSNLNNYLISPDSSDSEDHRRSLRKSVSSDNESLISSSIGDCLRQTTTEINSN